MSAGAAALDVGDTIKLQPGPWNVYRRDKETGEIEDELLEDGFTDDQLEAEDLAEWFQVSDDGHEYYEYGVYTLDNDGKMALVVVPTFDGVPMKSLLIGHDDVQYRHERQALLSRLRWILSDMELRSFKPGNELLQTIEEILPIALRLEGLAIKNGEGRAKFDLRDIAVACKSILGSSGP